MHFRSGVGDIDVVGPTSLADAGHARAAKPAWEWPILRITNWRKALLELRARANSATSVELSVIAAKAELPTNWQPQERYSGRRTPRAGPDKVIEYKRGSGLLERGVALREGLRSCAPNRPPDVLTPRVAPRKV